MSETITDIGGLRVVLRDDGGASIWDGDPTEGSSAIAITQEERLVVALALLGGLSDDLIERVGAVIAEQFDLGVIEGETVEQLQAGRTAFNAKVRTVLREAFGSTEPTE